REAEGRDGRVAGAPTVDLHARPRLDDVAALLVGRRLTVNHVEPVDGRDDLPAIAALILDAEQVARPGLAHGVLPIASARSAERIAPLVEEHRVKPVLSGTGVAPVRALPAASLGRCADAFVVVVPEGQHGVGSVSASLEADAANLAVAGLAVGGPEPGPLALLCLVMPARRVVPRHLGTH